MPVLQNVKHELFAQTLIETNGDAEKTMEIVGYKYSPSFFSQLKHNPKIAARIREIQKLALTDKVLDLTGRLELLSEFARNPALKPSARIRALSELHKQSGDDVSKVSMDLSAETKNVIKFVEIALPKITEAEENHEITGKELDSLDDFLKTIEIDDSIEDFLKND